MIRLLRARPSFRRLWFAGTLSLVGDWLSFVAVSLLAVEKGGGALALAMVLAVHALPQALVTPIAGVVADRLDRRKILLAVPLFQSALTLGMAFFAWRGEVGPVQVLLLVRSAATAFVAPAEMAALRHTVESDELTTANAVVSGTWSLAYVAGMALGGVIAVLGPVPAIVLDAFSFLLAAAFLRGMPSMRPDRGASEHGAPRGASVSVVRELRAALGLALERPALFRAVFSKAPVAVAGGAGWVVLNLVAEKTAVFGTAALSLGILQAVRGAGTGLGPLAASALPARGRAARWAPHLAVGLSVLGIAAFPVVERAPALLLCAALVWGMGSGANWVLSSASLQRLSPDSAIGRLASLDELATTAAMVAGGFIAVAALEGGTGIVAAALVGALAGLGGWAWLSVRGAGAAATGPAAAVRPEQA